jgi:hypothetical protein
MLDLLFLGVTGAFFILTVALVRLCQRLMEL